MAIAVPPKIIANNKKILTARRGSKTGVAGNFLTKCRCFRNAQAGKILKSSSPNFEGYESTYAMGRADLVAQFGSPLLDTF
jgi:hypothetical protein